MSDDIAARLRLSHRVGCDCVGCEAAAEIERLRLERDEALDVAERIRVIAGCEGAELKDIAEWVGIINRHRERLLDKMGKAIDAAITYEVEARMMRYERDDARRWVCKLLANPGSAEGLASPGCATPRDYAEEQEWDCFDKDEEETE